MGLNSSWQLAREAHCTYLFASITALGSVRECQFVRQTDNNGATGWVPTATAGALAGSTGVAGVGGTAREVVPEPTCARKTCTGAVGPPVTPVDGIVVGAVVLGAGAGVGTGGPWGPASEDRTVVALENRTGVGRGARGGGTSSDSRMREFSPSEDDSVAKRRATTLDGGGGVLEPEPRVPFLGGML